VWAQAVSKARTTDFEEVAAALRSQQWDTVIGKLSFDAKGDLKEQAFVWYIFKNGRYYEAGSE
jgi:branched-chain amino acid transport system substrate-binding protein